MKGFMHKHDRGAWIVATLLILVWLSMVGLIVMKLLS